MAVLFFLMLAHPPPLRPGAGRARRLGVVDEDQLLPSRVHAIVLVSKIHKPTLRALAYARATRPSLLEAITVDVEPDETKALQAEWDAPRHPGAAEDPGLALPRDHPPDRRLRARLPGAATRATSSSSTSPSTSSAHWWEQLLHNQSALRLKARLLFTPGVMVASVPWQLRSAEGTEAPTRRPHGRVGAAGPVSRRHEPARRHRSPRGVPGRHRRRGGDRHGRPRRPLRRPARRPGGLRPAHPARRARPGPGHRGRAGDRGSCAPTPSRCSRRPRPGRAAVPVLRSRPLRRLRLAARRPGLPARAQGRGRPRAAAPAGRARPCDVAGRGGARRRRRAALAHPGRVRGRRRRAGPGCAGTGPRGHAASTTA